MPAIVRFPEVVEQALVVLAPLFQNHNQRRHLGEYLTGLYIAHLVTSMRDSGNEFKKPKSQVTSVYFVDCFGGWDTIEVRDTLCVSIATPPLAATALFFWRRPLGGTAKEV